MKINSLLGVISLIIASGVCALPNITTAVEDVKPTSTTLSYQSFGSTYTKVETIPTNVSNLIMLCNEEGSSSSFEKEHNKHCILNNVTRHGERVNDSLYKNVQNYMYECYDAYKTIELTDETGSTKTCNLYTQNNDPVKTYTEEVGCDGNSGHVNCANYIYKVNEKNAATISSPVTTSGSKTVQNITKAPSITITTTKTIPRTTTKTVPIKKFAKTSDKPTVNCAKKWEQCGGINYNGSTCCESGLTCREISKYFSQCF